MNGRQAVQLVLLALFLATDLGACLAVPQTTISAVTATIINTPIPESTPPPPGSVSVWVTTGDQTRLFSHEPDLTFQVGSPETDNRISVKPEVRFQQIEGFGAAMTDSSAWLLMTVLNEAKRTEVMKNLFTAEGLGIRLSYLRIPMGASDFALSDYTYDDLPPGQADPELAQFSIEHDRAYILPALQLARLLNPALRFMGSPWSAPAWMKSGGSLHGGELLPEYYEAFARYHLAFIQAYDAEGIPIDAITPQNEPLRTSDSYPSMSISLEGMGQLIREDLGPALRDANLDTKLVVFDYDWDQVAFPLALLADPEITNYVDGVAFHCYQGTYLEQSRFHDAFPDTPVWLSECSGGNWEGRDFSKTLINNAISLMIGNISNWGSGVLLWNLALDENHGPTNGGCTDCRGVVTINRATGAISYTEDYYLLGHISRFVDPGAYRIETTRTMVNTPDNVAFLNPDGTIVLIVIGKAARPVSVIFEGYTFTYNLPDRSLVTFKWDAIGKP